MIKRLRELVPLGRKERIMFVGERELTREELIALINELRAENEKLKKELEGTRLAVEHNHHVAEENQLKGELRYRDGVIYWYEIRA